jgi:outer membrane immunogenic protein
MKKLALAVSVLAISAVSASAADMAPVYTKAPAFVPAPVYNWTGFYIGGNVGYGWGNGAIDPRAIGTQTGVFPDGPDQLAAQLAGLTPSNTNPGGVLGGVQAGYNWQFNRFVLGVETDFSGADIKGSASSNVNFPVVSAPPDAVATALTTSERLNSFGTLRGRAGFTVFDQVLLYATGGFAFGQANSSIAVAQTGTGGPANDTFTPSAANASRTLTGWTVGGGGEWAFGGNWSVKAEYLYYDLGHLNYTAPGIVGIAGATGTPFTFTSLSPSAEFKGSIVRVGLNYKFGGPVVAKY